MSIDRVYINRAADLVRSALSLTLPITKEQLFEAVNGLGGECVPVSKSDIKDEAQISTPSDGATPLFTIKYIDTKPEKRILFSIAHELGHLFLHLLDDDGKISKEEVLARRTRDTSKEELEANEFAAALLMPEEAFVIKCREVMSENKINLSIMAEAFNVSIQAATVRGNVLGLW